MTDSNNDYEVVAKYIKDISFEIPDPDCFIDAAQNLGSYSTKLDLSSKPFKNNLIELNCKFALEAPDKIEKKIHAEVCLAIVFKITNTKLSSEEVKKLILVTLPTENFSFMKEVVTDLFQKSGFKQFSFTKEVNFQELYNQQFSS
jgi:preprotein translocase subunit SecB|tara:strand:- start:3001 stop:3435 length:435 start_codon:yes stop_codon:yes gene_type:complete